MSVADSTSVFGEGTFEEQIQELVTYIVRRLPEDERPAAIRPFQEALKTPEGAEPLAENESQRKVVFGLVLKELNGLGEGSEKEIEGFFNMLYAHLLALYPSGSPELSSAVSSILAVISSALSNTAAKYRILSNLFNALPRGSSLRHSVYCSLLKIAISNNAIDSLRLTREDAEKWLSEWDISVEEKSAFLKTLVDAYAKAGQDTTSYDYALSYLRTIPSGSPSARPAAVETIATALRLPSIFNFDALFKIDIILSVKDDPIFSLLQVFLNGGLAQFKAWIDSNSGALEKYSLEHSQLERKIRLLTLSTVGFQKVGQHVPYSIVAETLQVDVSEVENWVIDVIRSGLLSGKLSQTSQTLYITRSTARTFEREQWETLEKRLVAWKAGLASVLDVVSHARKQGGGVHVIPPPAQTQAAA